MIEAFAIGFAGTMGALSALGLMYFVYQLGAGLVIGAEEEEKEEMK
jgi:hypothetical protein